MDIDKEIVRRMIEKEREAKFFFSGQYEIKLDNNGRFALPQIMQEKLSCSADGENKLIFIFLGQLLIFSIDDFSRLLKRADAGGSKRRVDEVAFYRWLYAEAMEAAWDDSGEIEIPRKILDKTGLKAEDELLMIGMKNWIEVWSPEDWEAEVKKLEFSDEELTRIHEILDAER